MIPSYIFEQLIRDSIAAKAPRIKPRRIPVNLELDRVITLSGARRCGKTSLMLSLAEQVRKQTDRSRVVYLNLEDDRLFTISLEDLNVFLETYYALYPANREQTVWFFLDEIQRVPGWELFIRRIRDLEQVRVCVTGSSAALLGREIATSLRGRTLTWEVFPLSFPEWLEWRQLPTAPADATTNSRLRHAMDEYLAGTAFPELIDWPAEETRMALREYVDLILFRDVAERLGEPSIVNLRYIVHWLLNNAARPVSVLNIHKDLKGQGLQVSKDSVYAYVQALEDAYLVHLVPLWTRNLKVRQRNPRKLYILDHALKRVVGIAPDPGAILENVVFLSLRRRYPEIHYWQGKQEVDLLVPLDGGFLAVNVCLDITAPETRSRELSALTECMEALGIPESHLVTLSHKEDVPVPCGVIRIRPAWEWLLEVGS